ncbi:MAG TPA: serine hydrolase domain-containing protein [Solirubrobacteraceae bacterium]|nr:serine hydrolase domain-containing protein [Solirubrobacteraceae bacterium]
MSWRERVRAAAEEHVGDERVPGLVVLVAVGDDVYVEAFGELTIGGAAVQRDSLFRIASTTKPITAAATLAVVEEGLVGLDEPVDRLLPELADRRVLKRMDGPLDDVVPASRAITTRDLLTFTFGFGMVTEMFGAGAPWPVVAASRELNLSTIGPPEPDVQPDPDTWIAGFGTLPLLAQPGERWMYNTGASVLGVLLARATGLPFADVLRTRLFEPLGMRDTAFWTSETDRLATAYLGKPDELVVWDEPRGQWSRPPAFGDGAAGLLSTADDLLAFSRALLAGGAGVLPLEGVRAMCGDQLSVAQKAFGGLGSGFFARKSWGYCQAVYDGGAFGWNGGLGTSWVADPAHDLTIIVMTQRLFESADLPAAHRDIHVAARREAVPGG